MQGCRAAVCWEQHRQQGLFGGCGGRERPALQAAGSSRERAPAGLTGARAEVLEGVLGVDAALNGVALDLNVLLPAGV